MQLSIGENIRQLRKQKDLSQEALAQSLCVSFQTVSKWERGESYPDIVILAGLSAFFGVSVDELMGMQKVREHETIADVFRRECRLKADGQYTQAAALLREALLYYPNNAGLMSELALALVGGPQRPDDEALEEAIRLCRRAMAQQMNEKVRATASATLCYALLLDGQTGEAARTAACLPHIWESRELILPDMQPDAQRKQALREAVRSALAAIHACISAAEQDQRQLPPAIASGADAYAEGMGEAILAFIG